MIRAIAKAKARELCRELTEARDRLEVSRGWISIINGSWQCAQVAWTSRETEKDMQSRPRKRNVYRMNEVKPIEMRDQVSNEIFSPLENKGVWARWQRNILLSWWCMEICSDRAERGTCEVFVSSSAMASCPRQKKRVKHWSESQRKTNRIVNIWCISFQCCCLLANDNRPLRWLIPSSAIQTELQKNSEGSHRRDVR